MQLRLRKLDLRAKVCVTKRCLMEMRSESCGRLQRCLRPGMRVRGNLGVVEGLHIELVTWQWPGGLGLLGK